VVPRAAGDRVPSGFGGCRRSRLDGDTGDGVDDVRAPVGLPRRAGRHPWAFGVLAARLEVDLEERAAGVLRVQLEDPVAVVVGGDQGHLPEPDPGHGLDPNCGSRFSRNARNASAVSALAAISRWRAASYSTKSPRLMRSAAT